jgi:hypothetical protein
MNSHVTASTDVIIYAAAGLFKHEHEDIETSKIFKENGKKFDQI